MRNTKTPQTHCANTAGLSWIMQRFPLRPYERSREERGATHCVSTMGLSVTENTANAPTVKHIGNEEIPQTTFANHAKRRKTNNFPRTARARRGCCGSRPPRAPRRNDTERVSCADTPCTATRTGWTRNAHSFPTNSTRRVSRLVVDQRVDLLRGARGSASRVIRWQCERTCTTRKRTCGTRWAAFGAPGAGSAGAHPGSVSRWRAPRARRRHWSSL
jgi:hypothetical protein